MITSSSYLQYFDGSQPVTIQVDASRRGLGATLIQENGPVEYHSKILTDTEAWYSNIEREMLAVVYGLEKFHYYTHGRYVVIETDHKPLEAIFKKHLSTSPPWIAKMMSISSMFQARMYLWQMRYHDLILVMVTQLKGSTCPSMSSKFT